jgi:hypothetical protein
MRSPPPPSKGNPDDPSRRPWPGPAHALGPPRRRARRRGRRHRRRDRAARQHLRAEGKRPRPFIVRWWRWARTPTDAGGLGQELAQAIRRIQRTALPTRTRFGGHGGSEALPDEKIERDPWLKRMFLGYAFSIDYRDRRGHAYMLADQEATERLSPSPSPARACTATPRSCRCTASSATATPWGLRRHLQADLPRTSTPSCTGTWARPPRELRGLPRSRIPWRCG